MCSCQRFGLTVVVHQTVRTACHCGALRLTFSCPEWCAIVSAGPDAVVAARCCLSKCTKPLPFPCKHACGEVCHTGPCPAIAIGRCVRPVKLRCRCGVQRRDAVCGDVVDPSLPCDPAGGCKPPTVASASSDNDGGNSDGEDDGNSSDVGGVAVAGGGVPSYELRRRKRKEQLERASAEAAAEAAAVARRLRLQQLVKRAVTMLAVMAFAAALVWHLVNTYR